MSELSSLSDLPARMADMRRRKIQPATSAPRNRCSEAGHTCERYLVYRRTRGEEARPIDPELQALFDLGRRTESWVVQDLEEAGVPLYERERRYVAPDLELAGSIDGVLRVGGERVVVDVKSMAPMTFQRVHTTDDMAAGSAYLKRYPGQLDLYLELDRRALGSDRWGAGAFLLANKSTGEIRPVEHQVDEGRLEGHLARLAHVNEHVHYGTLPERVDVEAGLCGHCPFSHICLPDDRTAPPEGIVIDEGFIELLEQRDLLYGAKREWEQIDDSVKQRLKAVQGWSRLRAGRFEIRRRVTAVKAYTVRAMDRTVITIIDTERKEVTDGD